MELWRFLLRIRPLVRISLLLSSLLEVCLKVKLIKWSKMPKNSETKIRRKKRLLSWRTIWTVKFTKLKRPTTNIRTNCLKMYREKSMESWKRPKMLLLLRNKGKCRVLLILWKRLLWKLDRQFINNKDSNSNNKENSSSRENNRNNNRNNNRKRNRKRKNDLIKFKTKILILLYFLF